MKRGRRLWTRCLQRWWNSTKKSWNPNFLFHCIYLYTLHISYRGDEVENPGYIMNMYWLPTIPNFQHYLNIVEPIVRINMWMHVNVCVTYFLLEFVPKIIKSITIILFCFERRLKIGQKREMRIYKWRYIYIYMQSIVNGSILFSIVYLQIMHLHHWWDFMPYKIQI